MPAERLSVRKIREILRLRWGEEHSGRATARSAGVSPATVSDCLARARLAGLSWPLPKDLDDAALESKLYPPPTPSGKARALLDFKYIHRELRRKGVTLQLLWDEYKADHPDDGYQYSRYCELYRLFRRQLPVVMHQEHKAGEKTFVDFSGDGIDIVDRETGEVTEAPVFVAVLGASSYTYAEAFESEQLRCWLDGQTHAFEYFEGVTEIVVPDQPRTVAKRPCYYDPDINPTYLDWAKHYRTAVIPARPKHPRDKAKVESGVLVTQQRILAALRNHIFFSIAEANEAIWEKQEELNDRRFKKLDTTRRELFETLDRPALKPLPVTRFVFVEWSQPTVNIDYHVEVDKHLYSVPYQLRGEEVDARRSATTVEILFKGRRVASHLRGHKEGGYTTCKEHMPEAHQQYLEWTPSRIMNWARKTGPSAEELARRIMDARPHPALGYRACLGLLRLGKAHGDDRLEAACARALALGSYSYKSVKSILKNGLDKQPLLPGTNDDQGPAPIEHDNVRGPDYYH